MIICINNFNINDQNHLNTLREDKINDLLIEINCLCGDDVREKFRYLFSCLFQTLASKGLVDTGFSGKCESKLKDRIYELTKRNPTEAIDTISESDFKYDHNLNETINKINYLAKPKFFNRIKKRILINTKCSHHI